MDTIYNKEEINHLILQYFEGNTSAEDEKILRDYFLQEDIDEDFRSYRPLFTAWNDLSNQPEQLKIDDSFVENQNNIYLIEKSKIRKYLRISATAIAGIAACILLFFMTYHPQPTTTFVIIDGVKYTDDAIVKNAFDASIENVRIDMEDVFSDFHGMVEDE